jgi:hypothetical protein
VVQKKAGRLDRYKTFYKHLHNSKIPKRIPILGLRTVPLGLTSESYDFFLQRWICAYDYPRLFSAYPQVSATLEPREDATDPMHDKRNGIERICKVHKPACLWPSQICAMMIEKMRENTKRPHQRPQRDQQG